MSHLLSKTSFVKGLQCEKQLYLYKYHYNLKDEISTAQQAIFSKGTGAGILAQQLFPGGANVAPEVAYKYEESIKKTKECIENGTKVIYEATFLYEDILILADILVREKEGWAIYEVKSSTSVSEVHLQDAGIQYYVISKCGLDVNGVNIVFINTGYIRGDKLDIKSLFKIQSVKQEVIDMHDLIEAQAQKFKKMLLKKEIPQIGIGIYCDSPYQCSFYNYCRKDIPEYSVFNISRLKAEIKYELYNSGIVRVEDVPLDCLNSNQIIEVESYKSGKDLIDHKYIKEFLEEIKYPISFMDFETFQPVVPLFVGTKPYQQIPFQYSVHYLASAGGELVHREFLAEPDLNIDPRIAFIERLINDLEGSVVILVYNQSFEITRLKELAQAFPVYQKQIEEIIGKIYDLMKPFQNKSLYKPAMKGSYSIKAVLPACVPELSYDNLEIKEGGTASASYESLYYETDMIRIKETREALLKYCGMDTYAMAALLEFLYKIQK